MANETTYEIKRKRVAAVEIFNIDVTGLHPFRGSTPATITGLTLPSPPPGITTTIMGFFNPTPPANSPFLLQFQVSGGTVNTEYVFDFLFTTSGGETLPAKVALYVVP